MRSARHSVTVSYTHLDGSKIIVQSGIVVFENGAKKVIENTLEISFGVGRKYYFLNEISNGLCSLWWSTVGYPSEGDYVPLCEVTSDGTLIDKRVFSVEMCIRDRHTTD